MATLTSASLFDYVPQFIEETTEGTTPTSGTCTAIGAVQTMSIKRNGNFQDIAGLGVEDLIEIVQGQQEYEISITYFAPTASTYLKYLVDAANLGTPTNTISASQSIVFGLPLNGTTNYIVCKGCRVRDGSIKMEVGKATEITVNIICMSIAAPTSTAPTGLTLASTPSGNVQDWLEGGTTPISWNASGVNAKSATININRNTKAEHTLGNANPYGTMSHGRRISGDFTVLWTNTTLETDFAAGTARTFAMVVDDSVYTLSVTGAKIVDYTRDYDTNSGDAIVEQCTFRGLAIASS